jgi:hypothetical protein
MTTPRVWCAIGLAGLLIALMPICEAQAIVCKSYGVSDNAYVTSGPPQYQKRGLAVFLFWWKLCSKAKTAWEAQVSKSYGVLWGSWSAAADKNICRDYFEMQPPGWPTHVCAVSAHPCCFQC